MQKRVLSINVRIKGIWLSDDMEDDEVRLLPDRLSCKSSSDSLLDM